MYKATTIWKYSISASPSVKLKAAFKLFITAVCAAVVFNIRKGKLARRLVVKPRSNCSNQIIIDQKYFYKDVRLLSKR